MSVIDRWTCSRCYADHVGFTVCQSCGVTRANRGFTKRWILHPCPVCGDAARCRCGLAECGHHGEREAVEVVPADQLAKAVDERETLKRRLVAEMCLTRTRTEMLEDFGPDYERYL